MRRILAHLRVRTGHDFTKYKRSTVLRRIARRMQVTRTDQLKDYYEVLRERAEEAQSLLSDLLISVTTFFRDAESFTLLQKTVIPELFRRGDPVPSTIRVWVPGCATGEEAYSIAILLLEQASKQEVRPTVQVFGTDLDAKALAIAREGRYPAAIEAGVNEERLRRFFTREGDAIGCARNCAISCCTVAILDVRIGRESVAPVARELTRRGIPFLFYTGQIGRDRMILEWPDRPVLAKPASSSRIVAAVAALLKPQLPQSDTSLNEAA